MKSSTILYVLFGLSGVSGLIYELVWSHYLKLFLGHAAYAQTLVLCIFMGGMTIGSLVCARLADRIRRPLLAYVVVETIIGVSGLFFHPVFTLAIDTAYEKIIPHMSNGPSIESLKWTMGSILIAPQSVMLGMTFPLMTSAFLRMYPEGSGRSVATLYFANSLGAAAGVFVSGFALVQYLGMPGTIVTAGALNIAIVICIQYLMHGRLAEIARPQPALVRSESAQPFGVLFFLVLSAVTGLSSFMYEIAWIRMLSLVLGSASHVFEIMLCAFITGIALGGLWIRKRIDGLANPKLFLAVVQVVMGVCAVATLPLYDLSFELSQFLYNTIERTERGFLVYNFINHVLALAIMLPATFCAGMTLPLITHLMIGGGHGEKSVGMVYATNTFGAILGVLIAVHAAMPAVGLKGLMMIAAAVDIALGVAIALSRPQERGMARSSASLALSGGAVLCIVFFLVNLDPYDLASGVYRHGILFTPDRYKMHSYRDGKTASIAVVSHEGYLSILTNGKSDASLAVDPRIAPSPDECTMTLAGAIGLAFRPDAQRAANIGLGSGLTSHVILGSPRIIHLDSIEIEPEVVRAAHFFRPLNKRVFEDPRSTIHVEDAKTFFSSHLEKYDIIVSEPSNPWVSGVSSLFSTEFYELINRHLTDHGILVQWLQLYEIDMPLVASIFKAISANFSDYVLYAPTQNDLLVVATPTGALRCPSPSIFSIPELRRDLTRVHLNNLQDIEIRRAGDRKSLDPLFNQFPIIMNSDYHPVIDRQAPKTRFMQSSAGDLLHLSVNAVPVLETLMRHQSALCDATDVTPSAYFWKSVDAAGAAVVRDLFMQGKMPKADDVVSEDVWKLALELNAFLNDPAILPGHSHRMDALFNIAFNVAPYLNENERLAFWNAVERSRGYASLSGEERNWVQLFRAVGRRDAEGMEKMARLLLMSKENVQPSGLYYLLASGMLGSILKGDKPAARELWTQCRPSVFGSNKPGIIFDFLVEACRDDGDRR